MSSDPPDSVEQAVSIPLECFLVSRSVLSVCIAKPMSRTPRSHEYKPRSRAKSISVTLVTTHRPWPHHYLPNFQETFFIFNLPFYSFSLNFF